ncbi:MAG: hypothetical protein JXQ71_17895 [Verrucomicrobia bacterium]|nr:hypothetical protein [Verrucomicrobiota bacterium]
MKVIVMAAAATAVVWLAAVWPQTPPMAVHARPVKPPPAAVDAGIIFFSTDTQVLCMNPDGSAKTVLLGRSLPEAEVSRAQHGGQWWFLVMAEISGQVYPDGRCRQEFFAVSARGDWVQLTDDPAIQPNTDIAGPACPRWTVRDGIVDGRVTFVGRRWIQDAGASWVGEAGVYAVDVDPALLGPGFVPQSPHCLPVVLPWEEIFASEDMPDFGFATVVMGCDWSPEGNRLVYALNDGRLFVGWADGSFPDQALFSAVAAQYPRWSPVQSSGRSQILFSGPSSTIQRINEDGSDWITVIPAPRKPNLGPDPARWSPSGTYIVYEVLTLDKKGQPVGTAVYRIAASGGKPVNLTSGIALATPLGWMRP